ncbi:hypothetical protein NCS52_00595600 [Fusarium sp. LHS14.1]|nr:hypothetical protein NCS52_00595600 [Fusarium sp. LHS14.1]
MWNPAFREDSTSTAGRFVHFRKTLFISEDVPSSLEIQITADKRYKLYVNKQLVAFGPVKGDANLWFYDELNISPYLRMGENHIAIHVLRLFHGTSWGTSFPRLGSGGVRIATTVDDAVWSPQIRSSSLWQTAIDPFVALRIDEAEDDFYTQKFQFKTIHNVESSLSHDAWEAAVTTFHPGDSDILIPAGTSHQLDLEAQSHTTAFIRFRFKRPNIGGARLTITYSESYEDDPELVPYLRRKENRLDTSKLNIQAGSSDLTMRGIDIETTHYPLEVLSSLKMRSDESVMEELYETSIRTLKNCMHDCYEDCPFYEQLQYAMDTRSSSLFTYYLSADDRLARQAILQLHSSFQSRIGLTASRAPSSQLQIIPHFSLYWVCMLLDHFQFYADKEFIRPFLPVLDAVLDYFDSRIDHRFDLVSLKNEGGVWNFHDWAEQWRPYGIPLSAAKSGISTYTNNLYAYTLRAAATLQLTCGARSALADEYSHRASQIVDAVKQHCFDGQYFTDSIAAGSDPMVDRSQHNQVWAVLSGAESGTAAQKLLRNALKTHQGVSPLVKTSISMTFYTLRAISAAGGSLYEDLFAEFWGPWRHQLSLGLTTWEEDDVSHRSDCHAWGSAPIYEFLAEVAGIRPAMPGWEELEFVPRVSLFPSLEATVPFLRRGKMALAKVSWH